MYPLTILPSTLTWVSTATLSGIPGTEPLFKMLTYDINGALTEPLDQWMSLRKIYQKFAKLRKR